jgi:predicted ATPase
MNPHAPVVVCLEGGPCSGKSSVLAGLQAQEYNYPVSFIPEIATELADELLARGTTYPELATTDRAEYLDYQRRIVSTYMAAITTARAEMTVSGGLIITDRGAAGVRAYVTDPEWHDITTSLGTSPERLKHDYADAVLLLGSLAVTDPVAYEAVRRSNPARTESAEQARALHFQTVSTWSGHGTIIEVDTSDLSEKQRLVRAHIDRLLGFAAVSEAAAS